MTIASAKSVGSSCFPGIGLTVPTKSEPIALTLKERVGLESLPISVIVQIQTDKKYLLLLRLVSYNKWMEIAIWRTKVSANKGWRISRSKIITPLVGIGWIFERKRNEST